MGVTVARWVATANRCRFFAKRAVSNAFSPMRDAVQEAAGYVRRLFPLFSEDLKPACGWTLPGAFAKPPAPGEILSRHSGRIAQLVEQLTLNQRVQGSSPCAPTNKIKNLIDRRLGRRQL